MKHGEEALYLSRRTGFIKMAMQHHAAVVPAFAFGQTEMYSWIKPGALQPLQLPEQRLHTLRQAMAQAAPCCCCCCCYCWLLHAHGLCARHEKALNGLC